VSAEQPSTKPAVVETVKLRFSDDVCIRFDVPHVTSEAGNQATVNQELGHDRRSENPSQPAPAALRPPSPTRGKLEIGQTAGQGVTGALGYLGEGFDVQVSPFGVDVVLRVTGEVDEVTVVEESLHGERRGRGEVHGSDVRRDGGR
jgi:hypothetical protein